MHAEEEKLTGSQATLNKQTTSLGLAQRQQEMQAAEQRRKLFLTEFT